MNTQEEDSNDYRILLALYDFTATLSQTLSFEKDDLFIFHSNNNIKKNWWSVVSNKGRLGYIPSNYVTISKVTREEYLSFLNLLIENVGKEIAHDGGNPEKQLELMQELLSKKQSIEMSTKSKIKSKEKFTSSKSLPSPSCSEAEVKKERAPPPPLRMAQSESQASLSCSVNSNASFKSSTAQVERESSAVDSSIPDVLKESVPSVENQDKDVTSVVDTSIPDEAVYSLVQQVRELTGLSFDLSKVAVGVVCEGLSMCRGVNDLMSCILEAIRSPLIQPDHRLENTPDAITLHSAFNHITTCRDDAQQRSWQLWDDEHTIKSNLQLIINVLDNADPEISKLVLRKDGYDRVSVLLEYYQMEDRWPIRERLLVAFTSMSALDKTVISVLLNSVLPMELAREMEANLKNLERITKLAQLLSVIFSTGEPMPITHIEHLGGDFVKIVLNLIESEGDFEIADVMLTLLLSYNLQFKPHATSNITVVTLSQVECVKILTEKLLLLINREEDPVRRFKVHASPYHSVLKLFMDIFSGETAAKLFYTNDIRVLVDIVTRQLTDLPPHNEKRTEYLDLCKLVLISCEKVCYEHRISELSSILTHILTEEIPPSESDRAIVRDILSNLPDVFGFTFDVASG